MLLQKEVAPPLPWMLPWQLQGLWLLVMKTVTVPPAARAAPPTLWPSVLPSVPGAREDWRAFLRHRRQRIQ